MPVGAQKQSPEAPRVALRPMLLAVETRVAEVGECSARSWRRTTSTVVQKTLQKEQLSWSRGTGRENGATRGNEERHSNELVGFDALTKRSPLIGSLKFVTWASPLLFKSHQIYQRCDIAVALRHAPMRNSVVEYDSESHPSINGNSEEDVR